MDRPTLKQESEALLGRFLQAKARAEAEHFLGAIAKNADQYLVRPIIRSRMGISLPPIGQVRPDSLPQSPDEPDAEDVRQQVFLHLMGRLWAAKDGSAPPVNHLCRYIEVTTEHAVDVLLRWRYPQRSLLANQLRYLLDHHPAFARWQPEEGRPLCGFADWRRAGHPGCGTARLRALADRPELFRQRTPECPRDLPLADLVAALFRWAEAPVALHELIRVVAELNGIKDRPARSLDQAGPEEEGESDGCLEEIAAPEPPVHEQAYQRQYLRVLWEEIEQLPARQAAACLLNGGKYGSIPALLLARNTTTREGIARVVGLSLRRFEELWPAMPLSDATLAGELEIKPQDVINLRQAARQRLQRRMRKHGFDWP